MSGTHVQNVSFVGVFIALSMSAWLTAAAGPVALPLEPPPLHAVSASAATAIPAVSPMALRRHVIFVLDMFHSFVCHAGVLVGSVIAGVAVRPLSPGPRARPGRTRGGPAAAGSRWRR